MTMTQDVVTSFGYVGRRSGAIGKAAACTCLCSLEREAGTGLEPLRRKGALPWPNPETSEALVQALAVKVNPKETPGDDELSSSVCKESKLADEILPSSLSGDDSIGSHLSASSLTPADELFAKVRELLKSSTTPKTDTEGATDLHVTKGQAQAWIQRLIDEGVLEKLSKPIRYRSVPSQASLFERPD